MTVLEILALYNENAALECAFTIPAEWYTDPRIEALERERVFAPNWIAVGRVDQLRNQGDFFTIELAGEPLVVVRGAGDELRAFFNVCRHHAAAVCTTPGGNAQNL
jgi:choline monooxygenase